MRGRQYTAPIVAILNKASFTEPVYDFTAAFDYLFEEFQASSADAERAFAKLSRRTRCRVALTPDA